MTENFCGVVMCLTVEPDCSKSPLDSREVTSSESGNTESSLRHTPLKSYTSNSTSASGAGRVLYNSTTQVPMASSSDTQVLPVYLVNPAAVSSPVPLLYQYVYPAAVGSQPVMHSPWLAASAAGIQVRLLSQYQSAVISYVAVLTNNVKNALKSGTK